MEIASESTSIQGNENIIKIILARSDENNDTTNLILRERRIKKSKIIEDLGYVTNTFLSKKIKHNYPQSPIEHKHKKESFTKSKTCSKIFLQFKSTINYQDYPLFSKIEKNVKGNVYTHYSELASDIRKTFTDYFTQYSFDALHYCNLLSLCDSFESIYEDYDNKIFTKDSNNLIEIKKKMNKLKKDLRESNIGSVSPHNNYNGGNGYGNGNKMKISFNAYSNGNMSGDYGNDKIASRKYMLNLANSIKHLSPEQKKGIVSILADYSMDGNTANTMEFDVNKMPINQLKELEKYVKNCVKNNDINVLSLDNDKSNINSFFLQKADSTMITQSQDIQSEKEKTDDNKQPIFSDIESLSSDEDSDSDNE